MVKRLGFFVGEAVGLVERPWDSGWVRLWDSDSWWVMQWGYWWVLVGKAVGFFVGFLVGEASLVGDPVGL